jgi:hypothetical protein
VHKNRGSLQSLHLWVKKISFGVKFNFFFTSALRARHFES